MPGFLHLLFLNTCLSSDLTSRFLLLLWAPVLTVGFPDAVVGYLKVRVCSLSFCTPTEYTHSLRLLRGHSDEGWFKARVMESDT